MHHISIIPDGNRRYLKKNQIQSLEKSYQQGMNKFTDFLQWCIDLNITEVTLYALSIDNIKNRSKSEIDLLMNLFSNHTIEMSPRIHKNKIKINICGDKKLLSKELLTNLENLEQSTRNHTKLILNLAIAYGGMQEIVHATGELFDKGTKPTKENIRDHLWVKNSPDIIIRTSESRLSNFLIWQGAYSEIYFIDKLWQEFTRKDLVKILADYAKRGRRYGG